MVMIHTVIIDNLFDLFDKTDLQGCYKKGKLQQWLGKKVFFELTLAKVYFLLDSGLLTCTVRLTIV